MIEENTPPVDPATDPNPNPAPPKKKKSKRTWKGRFKLLGLIALILALLFRVALNLLLPTVIRKVANAYDLDCTFGRIELSMLDGNAHIWNMNLKPKAGGESIVDADYVQGNISNFELLRGRLVCYRAEVDGVNILIDREPDGSIPLLKKLALASAAFRSNTPVAKATGKPQPVNLSAPLRVDAVRLSHVTTRLRDRSVSPVFEATVKTTVRLSDVGSAQQPARFELEVSADPVLDTLLVEGEAHNTPTSVDAAVNVILRGLHPKPAAVYLLPLGLKPVADNITVRAKLNFKATAIPNSSDVSADVKLEAISAQVDNEEWAALDNLTLDAKRVNPTAVEFGKLLIEGGRASARRTPTGGLRIAGLELAPITVKPNAGPATSSQVPAIPDIRISLDELDLKHLTASFDDQAVTSAGQVAARLDDMSIKNIIFDRAHPDEIITLAGTASVPGAIGSIQLTGSATPFAAKKHLVLKLLADGIKPDTLSPYLSMLGLESELTAGRFTSDLDAIAAVEPDGTLSANVKVTGLNFSDGHELLAVNSATIDRLGINPKTGAIKVASMQFSGPTVMIRREPSGNLAALGLRTRTGGPVHSQTVPPVGTLAAQSAAGASTGRETPVLPAAASATKATTLPSLAFIPRIELDKFSWKDVKLQFTDEMAEPKSTISVGDAGVEVTDMVIDLESKTPAPPGKFSAWISLPMIADRLAVEGTLIPSAQSLAIETAVSGSGITAKAVVPYLKTFGIQPVLDAGAFKANAKANLALVNGNLTASFDLANVVYNDGQTELAGVDAMHVSEISLKPTGIEVVQVQVDRPRARIARNADGSFQAGGVRFGTAAPTSQPVAVLLQTVVPSRLPLLPTPMGMTLLVGQAGPSPSYAGERLGEGPTRKNRDGVNLASGLELAQAVDPIAVPAPHPDPLPRVQGRGGNAGAITDSLSLPASPINLSLKGLHLHDGSITWTDNAMATPVNTTIVASADIDNVVVGPPGSSLATIKATARIAGVLDGASVNGIIGVAPDAPSAKLDIVADGIRAGDLAAYLPPGIVTTLKSGHFSGSIDTGISNNPAGGLAAHLLVNNVDLNDGAGTPLLKLESLNLTASRIDPTGGAIAIDQISSTGLETDVTLGADGAISAGGIRLITPPATTQPSPAPAVAKAADAASPVIAVSPTTQPMTDVVALVAQARKALPLLTLGKLNLGVKRLTISGATGPGGAPIELGDTTLRSPARIEVGGPDAESRPPVKIDVVGTIAPVAASFTANLTATPMAVTPTIALDVTASNISGKGLTDLLPDLKPTVDGSGLTQGTFRAHLDATINYGRRGPRDLDVLRGFTVDFDAKPVEFRSSPDGPVIGGLDEIRSDGIKVEPATGSVRIKAIEITKPIGRIARDKQGIRAFGVLIPLELGPGAPASQPAAPPPAIAAAPKPALPPAHAPVPMKPPTSVLRLDRLTVSGADVVIEDQTSTPVTIIPINGLDVDVRDINNQMPYDGKPMRFSVLATSDKVPLPLRTKGNSAAGLATKNSDGSYSEMRELFSQVTANGVVGIKQAGDHFVLDGWAKTSVNGFELLGVRGLAKEYEVTVGGGIFDDANNIRFNPAGQIETQNRVVVTNLSLSEPPNGPIQRALKISAPIDVAIGLITDPDGSITLNLPVPVKNGNISPTDVVAPALGAVAGVMVTAIASAPVKAISGIGNLLGIKAASGPAAEQLVVIHFLPGYTGLDPAGVASLSALVKRMSKEENLELQIRPELSAADVARAGLRTNPDSGDARNLAEQLRHEKADLVTRRTILAGQARGELGSRPESEARSTLASLKLIDRQIAQTENSLDQLYDLLRPGAQGQADRRTRSASLEILRQRLAGVRSALLTSTVKGADQRIHQTNPQFAPNDSADGGQVVITVISKKK